MNITLKKLVVNEAFSEETLMFMAEVYADGVHIGSAKNDGTGGSTHIYNLNKQKFDEAVVYCKALPDKILPEYNFVFEQSLESVVDDLVEAAEKAKGEKKLLNDMKKGLCFGTNNGYSRVGWKGLTIEQLLKLPQGVAMIKDAIASRKGQVLLNTNLPKEF